MAWTVAGIAGIWLAVLLISIFSPDLITDQQEQVPVAAFGAWFWGVVATGVFLWAMGRLRGSGSRQPEGRCRVVVGRSAAWGRPALPGCSTKLVSSATTILIGCPPVGSAVASVFEGRPARVLAGTPVAGADRG
jgi:hypothetical protein